MKCFLYGAKLVLVTSEIKGVVISEKKYLLNINYPLGLPVRPLIFLKKQKISLEELYGYASSDEESTVEEENAPQDAVPVADHVDEVPLCDEVPADESIPAGEGNIM